VVVVYHYAIHFDIAIRLLDHLDNFCARLTRRLNERAGRAHIRFSMRNSSRSKWSGTELHAWSEAGRWKRRIEICPCRRKFQGIATMTNGNLLYQYGRQFSIGFWTGDAWLYDVRMVDARAARHQSRK